MTSMDDSSSLEVVNEMMEIESEYNTDNKMENSYRAPYSESKILVTLVRASAFLCYCLLLD